MNFGKNLQTLRKQLHLSQEELAERMNVSRQAVSKWESDGGYPEMDKLLQLCEILNCSLDELVKGANVKAATKNTTQVSSVKSEYNHVMKEFSRNISIAIALILFGASLLIGLSDMGAPYTDYGLTVFLLFVAISVPIFVIYSLKLGHFKDKHAKLEHFYTEVEVDAYNRTFTKLVASGVGIILIGLVVFMGLMASKSFPTESSIPVMVFMFFIAVGAPLFVYAGINKGKYDIAQYNRELSTEFKKRAELVGRICGVIMLIATMIFMISGFYFQSWEWNWAAFPIGGVLCGIVGVILHQEE